MKLWIHIGFHKTGSSSFQAYCDENRNELKRFGLLYPETSLTELNLRSSETSFAGHRGFSVVLKEPESQAAHDLLEQLIDEAHVTNCDTIVLSSETFSKPDFKLSPKTAEVLGQHFTEVKILVYLRQQFKWAHSFYREYICWPRKTETRIFNDFCKEFLVPWLDYEQRLENWETVFTRNAMSVHSYDDRKFKNIVEDILNVIGFEMPKPGTGDSFNTSLPTHLVPLVLKVNAAGLSPELKSRTTQEIYRALSQSKEAAEPLELPCPFLENEAETYQASNERIAKRYGLACATKFLAANPGFDSKFKSNPEPTLAPAVYDKILALVGKFHRSQYSIQPNNGGWGVSVLSNESLAQIASFIEYHLAIGAEHIIVFLDSPDDPVKAALEDERVTFVACDEDFWRTHLNRSPRNNAEKLSVCHSHGLEVLRKRHGVAWAMNLDADELLWADPTMTVKSVLSELSADCNQVVIFAREAILTSNSESGIFSARHFKIHRHDPEAKYLIIDGQRCKKGDGLLLERAIVALFHSWNGASAFRGAIRKWLFEKILYKAGCTYLERLSRVDYFESRLWTDSDENLYARALPMAAKVMRCGFLGHSLGRVATSKGLVIDKFKSHRPESTVSSIRMRGTSNRLCVLHFDAFDYDHWLNKWYRRVYGDAKVENIGGKRRIQQDMFAQAYENGTARDLFKKLYLLDSDLVEEFEKKDLITKMEIPLIAEIVRIWLHQAEAIGKEP